MCVSNLNGLLCMMCKRYHEVKISPINLKFVISKVENIQRFFPSSLPSVLCIFAVSFSLSLYLSFMPLNLYLIPILPLKNSPYPPIITSLFLPLPGSSESPSLPLFTSVTLSLYCFSPHSFPSYHQLLHLLTSTVYQS